jgi:hypothetical protein
LLKDKEMKLFFAGPEVTELADRDSVILRGVKDVLLTRGDIEEVFNPSKADAIIIQEEKGSFKNFRYIDRLLQDSFIKGNLTRIFTISNDDSATGLLRGLYAGMPAYRFDANYFRAVPYYTFSNNWVFDHKEEIEPIYLAGWFGNTYSNKIRRKLVEAYQNNKEYFVNTSKSWYDHNVDEKIAYVELIKRSKFSLCPAGWAPPTLRLYESMAIGRCPVIIADNIILPKGPKWDDFSLIYSAKKDISDLNAFLLKHESRYEEMGAKAKENWDKYFAGDLLKQYYADSLLSLVRTTPKYTIDYEIKRWRSFSNYWNNNWTVPQRVINKFKLMLISR